MTRSLRSLLHLLALVALVLLATTTVVQQAAAQSYTARLVGGREDRNKFGDLLNYYIYAEEDAIVSPFPAYEIYRNGVWFPIYEPIVVETQPKKKAYKVNSSITYTKTRSRTISGQFRRDSTMRWTVIGWPEGATDVTGTNPIIAGPNNRFTITDWMFDYRGRYNVLFEVNLWNGDTMRFNRSITVDQQAAVVAQKTAPQGYNGSSLEPAPIVQLENLISQRIKSSTAIITFVILSAPPGGINTGRAEYSTNKDGLCELDRVQLSLPGTYVYRIDAKLSSGRIISTREYSLTIEKALPTRIELLNSPYGLANFLLFAQPQFRVYDQSGVVQDDRTNMTLRIVSNNPSFSYENQITTATLNGVTSVLPVNYLYTFSGLSFDMPGGYGIEAVLFLDEEEFMIHTFYITIDNPPTYLPVDSIKVNTIANISIYGKYPRHSAASPLYFAMSSDSNCATIDSSVIPWTEPQYNLEERYISIVPFAAGIMYMCMKTEAQPFFTKIIQLYLQKFTEAFPYIDSVDVADVSECVPLDAVLTSMYHSVGWDGAIEGRRYGCNLRPPVAGTVAPCTCPTILRCVSYRNKLFRPSNLDIGQCVCCSSWVLGLAGTVTGLAIATVLAVIYFYV